MLIFKEVQYTRADMTAIHLSTTLGERYAKRSRMPYWKLEDHEIIYDFKDQKRLNMQLKMGF